MDELLHEHIDTHMDTQSVTHHTYSSAHSCARIHTERQPRAHHNQPYIHAHQYRMNALYKRRTYPCQYPTVIKTYAQTGYAHSTHAHSHTCSCAHQHILMHVFTYHRVHVYHPSHTHTKTYTPSPWHYKHDEYVSDPLSHNFLVFCVDTLSPTRS